MATKAQQKTEAAERIAVKNDKAYTARERLKAANRERDATIAEAVSGDPSSVTWYTAPGILTIDEACQFAGLTATQLHTLMDRYRRDNPKKKTGAAPRRRVQTGAARRRERAKAAGAASASLAKVQNGGDKPTF